MWTHVFRYQLHNHIHLPPPGHSHALVSSLQAAGTWSTDWLSMYVVSEEGKVFPNEPLMVCDSLCYLAWLECIIMLLSLPLLHNSVLLPSLGIRLVMAIVEVRVLPPTLCQAHHLVTSELDCGPSLFLGLLHL